MLVSDRDASVVANCLIVLRELDGDTAMATKQNVYGLINRIKDFSEWSQVTILEVVALYSPADKTETFDIMNALEDRLQHSNSAVVLAAVKCSSAPRCRWRTCISRCSSASRRHF